MLFKIVGLKNRRAARRMGASICLLFVLLVVGGSLPALLGSRLCWPTVLAYLTSGFEGRVTARRASLGWFSPVVVENVVVDHQGQPLAQVASLRTESSLLSLLLNPRALGTIHIDRPALTVVLRDDGSNLEDALTSVLTSSSSTTVTGSLQITDGSIDVVDAARASLAQVSSIGGTIELPAGEQAPGTATLDQCHLAIGSQAGDCAIRAQWQSESAARGWSFSTQVRGMGLSLVQPLARRLGEDVRAEGVLTAELACVWSSVERRLTVAVHQARVESLSLTAPSWLGTDQLRLQSLQLAGGCAVDDGGWQFTDAKLECDAGQLTLDGQFTWQPDARGGVWQRLLRGAASADLEIDGQVDLARLARTLPDTLRIREGSTIEAGTVRLHLRGHHGGEQRGWQAQVETSELTATQDGRRFTWNDPLRVGLEVAYDERGWNLQQLDCHTAFLDLAGSGTPQSGSVELTCNLARLVAELHQLFDLGAARAAGTMSSSLRWQRSVEDRVTISGEGTIKDLELAIGPEASWREPDLQATLSLEADAEKQQLRFQRIRTGRVELATPTDRLELQLLEPVTDAGRSGTWSIGGRVRGQVANWLARARPFLSGPAVDGSGSMQLTFTSRMAPGSLAIQQLEFRAEPLRLDWSGLQVDEQAVSLELAGRWDFGQRQGSVPDAMFQSSALALRATDVGWNLAAAQPRLTGNLTFRADLARLQSSWSMPSPPRNWRTAGLAQGQMSLVQHEGSTKARWTIDVTGVELSRRTRGATSDEPAVIAAADASAWQRVWQEPVLKLVGSGQYDGSQQLAQLDQFDVTAADALKLSTAGQVADPFGQCAVDLQGQVTYDLAKLAQRVLPPAGLRLSGRDTQPFAVRGPLFESLSAAVETAAAAASVPRGLLPPALSGQGGLRWQSAEIFGIAVGPGALSASLAAGTLDLGEIETPVSQGTLRVTPHVHLNSAPPRVTLDAGQILTGVSISPSMCQGWLKYIAPLAADATRAEGKFSLSLAQAAIPVAQPAAAQVAGTLLIDSARIGPGPLTAPLVDLSRQIEAVVRGRLPESTAPESITWVALPQQQTQFQVRDRRVHHDRLTLQIDNAVIHTRGSVGFDQSLALVAQIPLQDAWLARDRRLAALQGMVVEIPVGGTLSRPQLDTRALEQLPAQVLRHTAAQLLEDGINRGLQQLLGPTR